MTKHYGDWNVLGNVIGNNLIVGTSSSDPSGLKFVYPVADSEEDKLLKLSIVDGMKQVAFVDVTGTSPLTVTNGPSAIDISLANSGATSGTYGTTTLIPVITVSDKGIITAISTVTVSGGGGGSGNLTGTLTANRIPVASGANSLVDSSLTFSSTGGISSKKGANASNEMFGFAAGNINQTGGANTFVGNSAGFSLTSGNYNTSLGWQSLYNIRTGSTNTAAGIQSGFSLINGSSNTLLGDEAGYALRGNTAGSSASGNVVIGNLSVNVITTGHSNSVLGNSALQALLTGNKNIALGIHAGNAAATNDPAVSKTLFVGDSDNNDGINDIYVYSENAYGPVFRGDYRFGNNLSFSGILASTDSDFKYDGTTLSLSGNSVEPLLNVSSQSVTGSREVAAYSYSGFNGISISRRDGYVNYVGNQVPSSADTDDLIFSTVNNSDSPTEVMRLTNDTRNLVMSGEVLTVASTTSKSGLNLPHGIAPTSPVNGDVWTTTLGIYVRVNGTTVGPLIDSSSIGELATITTDTVLTAAYTTIIVDASSNSIIITVPLASNYYSNGKGKIFNIKRVDGSSNLVSVIRSGADSFVTTTAGVSAFTVEEGESYSIQSDGANARWPVL